MQVEDLKNVRIFGERATFLRYRLSPHVVVDVRTRYASRPGYAVKWNIRVYLVTSLHENKMRLSCWKEYDFDCILIEVQNESKAAAVNAVAHKLRDLGKTFDAGDDWLARIDLFVAHADNENKGK